MSAPCADGQKIVTGTGTDASETADNKAYKAVYVSLGSSATVFKSYAERYAYLKGKAICTQSSTPICIP